MCVCVCLRSPAGSLLIVGSTLANQATAQSALCVQTLDSAGLPQCNCMKLGSFASAKGLDLLCFRATLTLSRFIFLAFKLHYFDKEGNSLRHIINKCYNNQLTVAY